MLMTHNIANGKTPCQAPEQLGQHGVLLSVERSPLQSFELDADRKIIAVRALLPLGQTGVPGATPDVYELEHLTAAPDEKVR